MLLAQQLNDISTKGQKKLYDEQLRALCEEMEDIANNGQFYILINSENCKKLGLNSDFWLRNPELNNNLWIKTKNKLESAGFSIKFEIIRYDFYQLTISWN